MINKQAKQEEECVPEMIIVVGSSAGGLQEVATLVESLPPWFRGTMIVANHREPKNENALAEILARRAQIHVHEAVDEQSLECTTIYVGRSNETVTVGTQEDLSVRVDTSAYGRVNRIDSLFRSVADAMGKNTVGIILSGMLSDGIDGLEAIQNAGGYCIVQSPADAQFDSMPKHAIERIQPDFVGTTEEICAKLLELAVDRFGMNAK